MRTTTSVNLVCVITSVDAETVMSEGRFRRKTQRTNWRLILEPDESHAERAYRGTIQLATTSINESVNQSIIVTECGDLHAALG